MKNGRIEPLQAPPVHQEAQPCLQPPQEGQIITIYTDFPLHWNTINARSVARTFSATSQGGPWEGSWPLEVPWRPGGQAPERRARHNGKQDENFVEVGIEGVVLNPIPRGSLGAGCAATHRSLEVGWRHRRMDTQPCAGRRPKP